jgi:hypothetical protein
MSVVVVSALKRWWGYIQCVVEMAQTWSGIAFFPVYQNTD